jgi:glycerol-3-phosphate acyltransferase PlsY
MLIGYWAIAMLLAYLLGSVSFAVLVSRAVGLADPRSYGSGNPGATNVLRTGHKMAAALTLLGDALKGTLAVILASTWGHYLGLSPQALPWVGLAAFLGHVFPLFLRFRGGKGVATALGVLFGLHWALGLATAATWLIIAFFFRYSSLAALVAAIFAPLYSAWLFGLNTQCIAIGIMAAVLVMRHHRNIKNLINGTETKIKN